MASDTSTDSPTAKTFTKWRSLRVWPAISLVILMLILRYGPGLMVEKPVAVVVGFAVGPLACSLLILIWWLSASRATWRERLVGFFGIIVSFIIVSSLVDPTMRGSGFIFPMAPVGIAAFAIGLSFLRKRLSFGRTWIALLLATLGFGSATLLRSSGMSGDYALEFHPRWTTSDEEISLSKIEDKESPSAIESETTGMAEALTKPEWPEFRGPDRSGVYRGAAIATDWDQNPPKLLWKTPTGPGWSSIAVAGNYLFTQEQRAQEEKVVCYDAGTGKEIWAGGIESRFEEPLGGPGPRATPTIANKQIFAMTAEGWLMRLDPNTGEIVWKQDLRKIADRKPPTWGFSSSPLVVGSSVIVYAGGKGDKGTLAFESDSGDLKWSAASGDHSYSSPQLATISGLDCVLVMTNRGIELLDPETGISRLDYEWKENGYRALQPQVVDGDSILLATGMNTGTRRIQLSDDGEKLTAKETWTSKKLKPDFNDFVVYQGHAYGFDASIFTSIDLATGDRNWKGGRYGKGQVLLLEKSGVLLVLSEQGEAVLLEASPEAHTELARFQILEGKTWNHPVVVGDRLYVRNDREAACYQIPLAAPSPQ